MRTITSGTKYRWYVRELDHCQICGEVVEFDNNDSDWDESLGKYSREIKWFCPTCKTMNFFRLEEGASEYKDIG